MKKFFRGGPLFRSCHDNIVKNIYKIFIQFYFVFTRVYAQYIGMLVALKSFNSLSRDSGKSQADTSQRFRNSNFIYNIFSIWSFARIFFSKNTEVHILKRKTTLFSFNVFFFRYLIQFHLHWKARANNNLLINQTKSMLIEACVFYIPKRSKVVISLGSRRVSNGASDDHRRRRDDKLAHVAANDDRMSGPDCRESRG